MVKLLVATVMVPGSRPTKKLLHAKWIVFANCLFLNNIFIFGHKIRILSWPGLSRTKIDNAVHTSELIFMFLKSGEHGECTLKFTEIGEEMYQFLFP